MNAHDVHQPDLDASLIDRLRAGDESAFDQLVRVAGGRMLAVARRMMTHEDDARDAVQDAFLSAFRSIGRFDQRSRLTTWLHRITVNACLMRLRTRRRKERPGRTIEDLLPVFLENGHQARPSDPWNPSPAGGIEDRETRDLVRAMIGELPEPYRVVLVLRDIEELSTEETAEAMGLTVNAVKARLHRARQALRTLLDPHLATDRTP